MDEGRTFFRPGGRLFGFVLAAGLLAGLGWVLGVGRSSEIEIMTTPQGLPPGSVIQAPPWYQQKHHTEEGYTNVYRDLEDAPFFKTMRWVIGGFFRSTKNVPPPVAESTEELLKKRPNGLRMTWIGHSTVYVQTPDLNVLTDPMFSRRASPFSFIGPEREVALPLDVEDLPDVDVVLISHDHYDHLDERSIRRLAERFDPVFLVPLGVGTYVKAWSARRVAELDWWQYVDLFGYRFHATPAEHFSGRSLGGDDRTLWAGWYVEELRGEEGEADERGLQLFYAGDTAYSAHFTEIKERLGAPHVAMLPIGAYLPRWLMARVHVTPEEAVQAFLDLEAKHMLAVHWGTFDLADEPLHAPAERVQRAATAHGLRDRVHLISVGASRTF